MYQCLRAASEVCLHHPFPSQTLSKDSSPRSPPYPSPLHFKWLLEARSLGIQTVQQTLGWENDGLAASTACSSALIPTGTAAEVGGGVTDGRSPSLICLSPGCEAVLEKELGAGLGWFLWL